VTVVVNFIFSPFSGAQYMRYRLTQKIKSKYKRCIVLLLIIR